LNSIQQPGRNDPCPCKSDRKYKKCCHRLEVERHGGAQQYSSFFVRDIVLEEIRSFREIFRVELTETDLRISDDIADSDVLLFVERVRNLWNSKADLRSLMPKKEDLRLRALYFASPDMFSTVNLLARYSLYCDQIIVIDPFSVFREMNRNSRHSPFAEPQAWVRQIVRDGVYLCSIEDWIRNDLVFATAFPLSFHDPLKQKHVEMMKVSLNQMPAARFDEIVQDTVESQFFSQFTPDELRTMEPNPPDLKLIRQAVEDEEWWSRVSRYMPGITKEIAVRSFNDLRRRKKQIESAIKKLESEPRRYQWALRREFEPRMDTYGSGMNLLDAKWFAETTGSHLVTDNRTIWNEILASEASEIGHHSEMLKQSLSGLAEAFQKLEFFFLNDIPLDFALQIRKENRLVTFRTFLRDFWNKVRREDQSEAQRIETIQQFRDGLDAQYQQFKLEFNEIRKAVITRVGLAGVSGVGAILSGSLGLGIAVGFLASALTEEGKKQTKRGQALSIFLDLESRQR
jgi:hypothetical protein